MFFHLTSRSVAPAAANGVQIAGVGAVDVGVAVADHHGLVPRCSIKTDFVEAVPNHLILVQTRVIPGCAIDAVQQLGQMEMLTDRNALVLGLAAGQRQIIAVGTQLEQLFADTGKHDVHQAAGNFVAGLVRIIEHGAIRIVAAVDIHGPIQIFRRHMIATQRFDNRWSNEASQFGGVRNRATQFLERLDDGSDDAAVGLGKRAVEIQQDHFHRMLCH